MSAQISYWPPSSLFLMARNSSMRMRSSLGAIRLQTSQVGSSSFKRSRPYRLSSAHFARETPLGKTGTL